MQDFGKAFAQSASASRNVSDFVEQAVPAGIAFQNDVIVPFERDETCAGDAGGEPAAFARTARTASSRQCSTSVGTLTCGSRSATSMSSTASRMRTAFSGDVVMRCRSLNHCICSGGAAGNEQRGEDLAEGRILLAPALAHQRDQSVGLSRSPAAIRACAGRAQSRHRARDGSRAPDAAPRRRWRPRNPATCRAGETGRARPPRPRFRDRARRRRTRCPRRPSRTGRCRACRSGSAGDRAASACSRWLQIGLSQSYSRWLSQLRGLHQRRALADFRIGDANAVGRRAEMNLLPRMRAGAAAGEALARRAASSTVPTKRMPLRAMVRISRCSSPLSPTALRAALMRLVSVESDTMRPPQTDGDQIVLAHHAVAILHEVKQQVEHLRLDRDQFRAAPKLAPVGIKYMIFKAKLHRAAPRITGRYQAIIKPISRTNQARGKVFGVRMSGAIRLPSLGSDDFARSRRAAEPGRLDHGIPAIHRISLRPRGLSRLLRHHSLRHRLRRQAWWCPRPSTPARSCQSPRR